MEWRVISPLVCLLFCAVSLEPTPPAQKDSKRHPLEGTWERSGAGPKQDMRQIKIINTTHYVWFLLDKDNKIFAGAGGACRVDGDKYTEIIEFASEYSDLPKMIGKEQNFKVIFDKDRMRQIGILTSGFEVDEIWTKARSQEANAPSAPK